MRILFLEELYKHINKKVDAGELPPATMSTNGASDASDVGTKIMAVKHQSRLSTWTRKRVLVLNQVSEEYNIQCSGIGTTQINYRCM